MGWLSNIFGGGSKTTMVENDPYKNMPEWMQDAYRNDAAFREDLLDDAGAEGLLGVAETAERAVDRDAIASGLEREGCWDRGAGGVRG